MKLQQEKKNKKRFIELCIIKTAKSKCMIDFAKNHSDKHIIINLGLSPINLLDINGIPILQKNVI